MKLLIPRFAGVDVLVIPEFESWLTDHSARGLHFRKCAIGLLWFERGEKKAVRYRLDAISPVSPVPDVEKRAQAASMGWRYINKLGMFSVYASEDATARELHTDPVVQSYTMDTLARKLKLNLILLPILLVSMVALAVSGLALNTPSVVGLVEGTTTIFTAVFALLELFIFGSILAQSLSFLSLRRKLRSGISMEHRTPYRARAVFNLFMVLFSLVIGIFSAYCSIRYIAGSRDWSITAEKPAPIAFDLSVLETGPDFAVFSYPEQERNWSNFARSRWSFFAPTQYFIRQTGGVGETWPDGRNRPSANLSLDYYELSFPSLASPFFDELLSQLEERLSLNEYARYTRQELSTPDFDRAILFTDSDGENQLLLVATGWQVALVDYSGTADLESQLPQLSAALAAMQ